MTGALSMGNFRITDVGNSTNAQDAVIRYDLEQLRIPHFVVTSGTIPATTSTDITIYTLPSGKTVANGKITIGGLWVERGSGEWFDVNCGEFCYQWTELYIFTRGSSFIFWFTGLPASRWTRNYRLHTLEFSKIGVRINWSIDTNIKNEYLWE